MDKKNPVEVQLDSQGCSDSNADERFWRPVSYHWMTPLSRCSVIFSSNESKYTLFL
jgi:hypothetical protein